VVAGRSECFCCNGRAAGQEEQRVTELHEAIAICWCYLSLVLEGAKVGGIMRRDCPRPKGELRAVLKM
jgi:hypothetical protein